MSDHRPAGLGNPRGAQDYRPRRGGGLGVRPVVGGVLLVTMFMI
jgi:hypothetical protein